MDLEKAHGIILLVKDKDGNLRIVKNYHSVIIDAQGIIFAEDMDGKRTMIGQSIRSTDGYTIENQQFTEIRIMEDFSKGIR